MEREAHRRERTRRLTRNVIVGIAGRGVNALVALATVPLLLRILGTERYGLYVTVTAVMAWIQIGVLGFGKGLVNGLVEAQVRGDEARARRSFWSFWAGLAVLVVALAAVLAAAFPAVPWRAVFPPVPGMPARELEVTVALALAFTLAGLALSPVPIAFTAFQEERIGSVWTALRNVATLPALGAVLLLGAGLPGVTLAVGASALAVNLGSVAWLLGRHRPALRPRRGDVRRDELARTLAGSAAFFAVDLAAVLVVQTDKLLIIQLDGPAPVARFELASMIFLLAQSVFGVFLMPMWPALGEAIRRGDHSWARRVMRRFVAGSAAGMTAVLAVAVAVGPPAIGWWTGTPAAVPGRLLILLVGAYFVVRTYAECHSIALYSLDRQRDLFLPTLANGVVFVGLGIAMGRAWGLTGVVVANLVAFAATQGALVPWLARRRLAQLWPAS